MSVTTIFLPGIMGSELADGEGNPVWHRNIISALKMLAEDSSALGMEMPLYPSGIMECVEIGGVKIVSIYQEMVRTITEVMELRGGRFCPFPYDWRADVERSARLLGEHVNRLSAAGAADRIILVAHRLGGLVVASALTTGVIDHAKISAIVCIGSPFFGAPAAFGALYRYGYLPGLGILDKWVGWARSKKLRRQILLRVLQECPSIYQMLPQRAHPFVCVDRDGGLVNPLNGNIVSPTIRDAVSRLHQDLLRLPTVLQQHHVPCYLISSLESSRVLHPSSWFRQSTPQEYSCSISANTAEPGSGTYSGVKCRRYTLGDGTVPSYSSSFGNTVQAAINVVGVDHFVMCDSESVLRQARSLILKHAQ